MNQTRFIWTVCYSSGSNDVNIHLRFKLLYLV